MPTVQRTDIFIRWLKRLRDKRAVVKIMVRIDRLARGNPGDHRNLGGGLIEMRIDHGPGYRVYWIEPDDDEIVLLCGGDKRTQQADIAKAHAMIEELQ